MAALDSDQFAKRLGRKSERAAKHLVDRMYDDDSRVEGEQLVGMLRSFMWNEFYFGTYPPAKQMNEVYERNDRDVSRDIDIVIELANMARDELKHAKLFSNRIEELGGNPDIRDYTPTEAQVEMFHRVYDHDDLVSLAACQQMGIERFVPIIFQALVDHDVVDDRTKEVLHSADLDEPNHLNVGRKIILRFADDEEVQRRADEANSAAIEAMYDIYGLEYDPEVVH
ncbi:MULTISPECIES: ferritin-like domain-containing protein [Halorussus]|uniref:ferritin-like domain-containing protein n=1 Tax=Halorussus TaxID=1070314 RepID=UPI00209F38B5|nr:ferritin-like domain-containing protein [Halorussus vallis]USZ77814.1 ferritin-like domain-containing protein [Halorussus vallis]